MPAELAYVLTPTDVHNIRSYVHHKYASMPSDQRAEIVADAVARIIHNQLPDFDLETKKQLTYRLIRSTVLEQQRPVSPDDIFVLCMELDMENPSVAEPFRKWRREQEASWSGTESARLPYRGHLVGESEAAIVIPLPSASGAIIRKQRRRSLTLYGTLTVIVVTASMLFGWSQTQERVQEPSAIGAETGLQLPAEASAASPNELPSELKYALIDKDKLISFLESKSSILADSPYIDAIMKTAKEFDIHPAFLIAITGQEQGFVPRKHERAKEIANNPFNVFHSWQAFNTSIEQSSQIAARTITRLSKDRPSDVDPFTWINREYAEDPNWSKGVRTIFASIIKALETSG
ncbi:hypothetical protein D3P07_08300 [Paenibacillus sp. 1011MAR3C5]|uniref:glucosaminidase domain-containing protein n=1 Tax=Paenibacillus sp. 1011MAR3C5 TaxID=1675787 RepID=UPI000E6CC317|nr:glucosaminidase domain-containing protein [Paenibacillus sp. 1011MAR3C5]RJE90201.1 hypothetical protein D3P07_08300 [Paenibacillus sp. 1011MAR3C5]